MAPMPPEVKRARIALVASGAIVVISAISLYLMFSTVITFVIGALLACVLQPLVHRLESWMPWRIRRPALCRTLAILIIYAAGLGILVGVLALIIPPAYQQTQRLITSMPDFYDRMRFTAETWNEEYSRIVPENIRHQIGESLPGAADILTKEVTKAVGMLGQVVSGTLALLVGLLIVPMFLYYLLKDQESLSHGLYGIFPESIQSHLHQIIAMTTHVVGAYMRSQLILGVVVGLVVFLGLFFMDVEFAMMLGLVAGIAELIPMLGPTLGALVGILVTLATSPEKVPWVIALYLGVQALENVFLVPRIEGNALRLHPIMVMVIIVIASQVAGLWGVIMGPPVVAVVRDMVHYFHREWHRPAVAAELRPLVRVSLPTPGEEAMTVVQPSTSRNLAE
ncbi:MAG: AI-2E family transporter [SAR202 cluster bacterium]|nr:AI-2E family transporter [SAR202 cluster bacterium]